MKKATRGYHKKKIQSDLKFANTQRQTEIKMQNGSKIKGKA